MAVQDEKTKNSKKAKSSLVKTSTNAGILNYLGLSDEVICTKNTSFKVRSLNEPYFDLSTKKIRTT